jgi:hypothetical protein
MAWLDSLLRIVTYPADSLPGRLGRRIRRARRELRKTGSAAVQVTSSL